MLLTTITVAVLAAAAAWVVAGRLHRFAYWIDKKSDAAIAALAQGRWRVDRLAVAPGVDLGGLVRQPTGDGPHRWILFVPGNSTALLPGFRQELDRCCPAAAGVAFWAYRGFDNSGGVPTPAALRADLDKQWQRVRELAGGAPIEVFGYSLGSPLAVQLAGELCARGEAPARLVLAAAAPSIPVMPAGLFGRFRPDDVYDATAGAPLVTCPVAIVHGEADDALPLAGARALAARFKAANLYVAPGKGHADLWDDVARQAFGAR
ncbi:MAG: thioesterase domain-containing protein [Planctomycetota bacterium]